MTANDRLDEIQARADAATRGPWSIWRSGTDYPQSVVANDDGLSLVAETFTGPQHPAADAEFIAHARTDVPALVAALRLVLNRHSEHVSAPGLCLWCEQPYPCSERRDIMSALGEVAP